jgi:hypothetical protein
MGLLDEAIREHLELKRLRASDGSVPPPEQGAAPGPVPGSEPSAAEGEVGANRLDPEPRDETPPQTGASRALAGITEETVELEPQPEHEHSRGAPADRVLRADRDPFGLGGNASTLGDPDGPPDS